MHLDDVNFVIAEWRQPRDVRVQLSAAWWQVRTCILRSNFAFLTRLSHSYLDSKLRSDQLIGRNRYTLFEGGTRVSAFISGGAVPMAVRGTTSNTMIHEVRSIMNVLRQDICTACHVATTKVAMANCLAWLARVCRLTGCRRFSLLLVRSQRTKSTACPSGKPSPFLAHRRHARVSSTTSILLPIFQPFELVLRYKSRRLCFRKKSYQPTEQMYTGRLIVWSCR